MIGDDAQIEQVMKQLNKLIDVIKVSDLTDSERVERELALFKVTADQGTTRAEIMQIATIFRAQIVDVGAKSVILQIVGDTNKIDAMEKLLRQFGIKELIRTGRIGICVARRPCRAANNLFIFRCALLFVHRCSKRGAIRPFHYPFMPAFSYISIMLYASMQQFKMIVCLDCRILPF